MMVILRAMDDASFLTFSGIKNLAHPLSRSTAPDFGSGPFPFSLQFEQASVTVRTLIARRFAAVSQQRYA